MKINLLTKQIYLHKPAETADENAKEFSFANISFLSLGSSFPSLSSVQHSRAL